MGTGARFRWEGPVAGMACIGSVTVGVAADLPQFKGISPWSSASSPRVLTPLGPAVANQILASAPGGCPRCVASTC